MPNMTIIAPTDYNLTKAAVTAAALHKGPVYIRLTRDKLPIIYNRDVEFKIGKSITLEDGNDVTIISIGDMTHIALEAVKLLKDKGISVQLIDMPTLKPIDKSEIINAAKKTGAFVTVEDHQINGGLGSAVAEVLAENCPVPLNRIGLRDTFAESGDYRLLLEKYSMSAKDIADASREAISRKK